MMEPDILETLLAVRVEQVAELTRLVRGLQQSNDDLAAQLASLQWSPITESNLPQPHDEVQIYSPSDGVEAGYVQMDSHPRWFTVRTDSYDERMERWPTHWAPMLAPPAPSAGQEEQQTGEQK